MSSRTWACRPSPTRYLSREDLLNMERFYPLKVFVCENASWSSFRSSNRPRPFSPTTPIFRPFSESWLRALPGIRRTHDGRGSGSGPDSLVVEVASNDGYLLQYFKQRGVPVLGIEPAANVARGGGGGAASRPWSGSSASETAADPGGRGPAGRPADRQQRPGPRAGPERFRRGPAHRAEAGAGPSPWSSRT